MAAGKEAVLHAPASGQLEPATSADLATKPSAARTSSRTGLLETRDWIERSISRCQCEVTTRFLERMRVGIETRLHAMEAGTPSRNVETPSRGVSSTERSSWGAPLGS